MEDGEGNSNAVHPPSSALQRKTPHKSSGDYTIGLLKGLGVPRELLYARRHHVNGSFWTRNVNHLEILFQAHRLYRRRMAVVHPDCGGSARAAMNLNRTWSAVRRRFGAHGHVL